jgi:hypothetical protein
MLSFTDDDVNDDDFDDDDTSVNVENDTIYDNKLNNNGGGASILAFEYKYFIRGLYVPHINGTIHNII